MHSRTSTQPLSKGVSTDPLPRFPPHPAGASISTTAPDNSPAACDDALSVQPLAQRDLIASLSAALQSRQAAEQRIGEMSKEVAALKASNHQLMRCFNRDWKRKAMQLEESKAALHEEVSELRERIAQLQRQASACDAAANRTCKVTRPGMNRR